MIDNNTSASTVQYRQSQWGSEGLPVACCGCQDILPLYVVGTRRSVISFVLSCITGRRAEELADSTADNRSASVWCDRPASSSFADEHCLPEELASGSALEGFEYSVQIRMPLALNLIAIVVKAKDSIYRRRKDADGISARGSCLSQCASRPSRHKAINRGKGRPLSLNIPAVAQGVPHD